MDETTSALAELARRRCRAADGVVYGWDGQYVTLWQLVAGSDPVWDAGPAVVEQIPRWDDLEEAVTLLQQVVAAEQPPPGDWLVLRLP